MHRQLFIPRSDAAELLDATEVVFDQMSGLVTMPIIVARCGAIGTRRNDCCGFLRADTFDQRIAVVAFVGNHRFGLGYAGDEVLRLRDVGLLGASEREGDWIAQGVDERMDFRAESAARSSQSLRAVFFWAPAACEWARTAVLSSITSSRSCSLLRARNTRSHTPFLAHRAKRVNVVCQLPSSGGKSRHGAPVQPIHNTASMNRRLSWAVTPTSLALPGSKDAMHCHWSSRNTLRFISNSICGSEQ